MTAEEVRDRVEKIRAIADDDEAAHHQEDQLHQDVLTHLAAQGHNIAAEALRTIAIDFARWCA
jgi:hypothetical protein